MQGVRGGEHLRAAADRIEKAAHIQRAGCKAKKKSVIGAHNRCWKYLTGAISTHGEAKRSLEFIGGDKDRQLKHLWAETKIGEILPWDEIDEIEDEAERLLESARANRQASDDSHRNPGKEQEDDQAVDRDETDPYNEVIFGRRRPDSVAIDWTSKTLHVLEFKRTSDQRQEYRERGESRARALHDVLVKSLEKVAGEADGESEGWKVKEADGESEGWKVNCDTCDVDDDDPFIVLTETKASTSQVSQQLWDVCRIWST